MAARCARIRISWALLSGAEAADIGFYFLSPSGSPLGDLVAAQDAEIDGFWTDIDQLYKPTTTLTKVRVDEIDINTGHVISGIDGQLPVSPSGTVNSPQLPLQCSSVVTLRTPFSGASFRGRVYMPPMHTGTISTLGYLDTTPRSELVSGVSNYLNSVNAGTTDWSVAVYSRKNSAMTPVTSIDVGTVIDTIRARRGGLVESRLSSAITP